MEDTSNWTCDCGDPSMMRSSGFCPHHGSENVARLNGTKLACPPQLRLVPQLVLERVVELLLLWIRSIPYSTDEQEDQLQQRQQQISRLSQIFEFLTSTMLDCGSVIREAIANALMDDSFFEAHGIEGIELAPILQSFISAGLTSLPTPPASFSCKGDVAVSFTETKASSNNGAPHLKFLEQIKTVVQNLIELSGAMDRAHAERLKLEGHEIQKIRQHLSLDNTGTCYGKLQKMVIEELYALHYRRPIDEFMYWLVHLKFHKSFQDFILNMLAYRHFKVSF